MRNNLLQSAISVFVFWWIVITIMAIFGDGNIEWSPTLFVSNMSITGMSVAWGILISSGAFVALRIFSKAQLIGAEKRGISVNLGPFPVVKQSLPRYTGETVWQPRTEGWIKIYGKVYPEHMKLMQAVGSIIDAHPLHPASIEPGGHGDRTLLEHSHNVAEIMLELAPHYEYKGLKLLKSDQTYEQIDPLYSFSPEDPLIPLVGLVHDIGKIECYEITLEGNAIEKRSQHDWRGRFLVGNMPEFWNLPDTDRSVLLDTIGFYHHSWALPENVSDRARALIDLVLKADIIAGEREAKNPKMATAEDVYEMVRRMLITRGKDPDLAALPDRSIKYETVLKGEKLSLHQSRILYFFEELMCEPGRVNGSDTEKRIGIKIGDVIYCTEEDVRNHLGKLLLAKKLIESTKLDSQKILTTSLMEVLSLRGSLINVVDGHEFGPGRALFKLTVRTKGKNIREYIWPAVFMIDAKFYKDKNVSKLDGLDFEVISVTPVYNWNQARKKSDSFKKIEAKTEDTQKIPVVGDIGNENEEVVAKVISSTKAEPRDGQGSDSDVLDSVLADHIGVEYTPGAPDYSNETDEESVTRQLYEGGNEGLSLGIQTVLDAGEALGNKPEKTVKQKKRDSRRNNRAATEAASPVISNSWWEADNGKETIYQIISLVRENSLEGKEREIDGISYSLIKLSDALRLLDIPVDGEEKVMSFLNLDGKFIFRKSGSGENFIGIPRQTIDNV